MAENTTAVPPNLGALASRDYTRRAAYEHRATVRRIMERGARSHAAIAAELNQLGTPSGNGRAWSTRSAGLLLKRLGVDQQAWAERDLEAYREPMEYLWGERCIRTRPQIVIALERMAVRTADGRPWTVGRVGKLIRFLGLDWSDGAPMLRRGDTVPEVIEVPGVAELMAAIEPQAAPVIEAAEPIELEQQEARPRRRAVRI